MIVAIVLIGSVGGVIVSVLADQQRFYTTTAALVENRTQLREAGMILRSDLRGASPAGGDIRAMDRHALDIVANTGSAIVCRFPSATRDVVELPPLVLANRNVLSAWLVPPRAGDVAYIHDDRGGAGGSDDRWQKVAIDSVRASADGAWCPPSSQFTSPGDARSPRYRLYLRRPLSSTTTVGAPIRFGRAVRYRFYHSREPGWFLGADDCEDGMFASCTGIQPVAGPYTDGARGDALGFLYVDDQGTPTTDPRRVARVDVVLRTETRARQARTGIGGPERVRSASVVTVALRNRP
ncbi:MAG: hypothetical protein NVS1B4_26800 [Gemmatimonadaceae bacterium]